MLVKISNKYINLINIRDYQIKKPTYLFELIGGLYYNPHIHIEWTISIVIKGLF